MENQKKWCNAGRAAMDSFLELLNFEKTFQPELEAKIAAHKTLEGQAGKMKGKVAAAQGDFDKLKVTLSGELQTHEAKIREDLRKEFVASGKTGRSYESGDAKFEHDTIERLTAKAEKCISPLRSCGQDLLKSELLEAETLLEIQSIEEQVFQARRQAARKFCLALFQTAGLALGGSQYDASFPETLQAQAREKKLRADMDIACGRAKFFEPLRYDVAETIDILSMAGRLPKSTDSQLLDAWSDAKNKRCRTGKISYSSTGVLSWSFLKSREPGKKIGLASSDFTGGRSLTVEQQAREDQRAEDREPRFPKETFHRD